MMKLSDAIRLGALLRPQGHGGGTIFLDSKESCALGAALEAAGVGTNRTGMDLMGRIVHAEDPYNKVKELWPIVMEKVEVIPPAVHENWMLKANNGQTLGTLIWILNDAAKWSREKIADWVEAIENEHEAKQREALLARELTTA